MKKLFAFFLFFFSIYSFAQQGTPNFTNYGTEQGLALSSVHCGYVGQSGNLWFGTAGGGVSRYGGDRVEAMKEEIKMRNEHNKT